MKINFDFESGTAVFPKAALARIKKASDTAVRLLIILAADDEARQDVDAAAPRIMKQLGCDRAELDKAIAFWCGAGVADTVEGDDAETAQKPSEQCSKTDKKLISVGELPDYTMRELGDMLEQNEGSLHLVDEAQRRLGRIMNEREIGIIVGLQNHLELSDEYLYVLLDYCARIGKTSVRYVEKLAFGMYDEDVHDADVLEERLRQREEYATLEGKLKALIGARGRKLSVKETRFLNRWALEMKYSFEMIELAYDITVDTQHEYNPAYMNGILEKWYSKSIMTPEQVHTEAEQYKKSKQGAMGSFDTNEFFEAALSRSYSDT